MTQEISKALGIVLTKGPVVVCEPHAIATAKQKLQLTIHLVVARVLVTMIKCIWIYHSYMAPISNTPTSMFGI